MATNLFNNKISFELSCDEKSVFNLRREVLECLWEGSRPHLYGLFAELRYGEITVRKNKVTIGFFFRSVTGSLI